MTPKIKNLLNQIATGKIRTNEAKILNFIIERNGSNLIHMRSLLNIPHQTLTSRLSSLEDYGIIYKGGIINNGKHSQWLFEPNEEKQRLNALSREKRMFNAWKKQGILKYDKFMNSEMIIFLNN